MRPEKAKVKIKQLYFTVALIAAGWTLCGVAYNAGMLHGESLMLTVAAVATLSVVIALVIVASTAARWIVQQQGVALAAQRAELVAQRAVLAAHSARMQEVGDRIREGLDAQMGAIRDEVVGIYAAGVHHDRMATVRADNTSRWGRDDLGTGPQPIYEG